jgi:1-acyl-sn-glycerol-3-phosphate acyltransferase
MANKVKKEINWPYKFFSPLLRLIFKIKYNPIIINKEVIPKEGPILIVSNHKHIFDQCFTIMATKRVIHYMAKKEYFDDKKVAWFFKLAGCIPVNREIHDEDAKERALNVLRDG